MPAEGPQRLSTERRFHIADVFRQGSEHAALRPGRGRGQVAEGVGGRGRLHHPEPRARGGRLAPAVRARDAAVPLGRPAHGARQELHDRRRALPPAPPPRPARAAPDGLRRVRPARRERRDPRGPQSARRHERQHRGDPQADEAHGLVDRLVARALHGRAGVLPLDAVDLPAPVRARPGLQARGARQLVPGRSDRARQRAGHRRPLRALRVAGREPRARAVVLQDHRLRPAAAGRHGAAGGLARARPRDAAQLDRALGRCRGAVPPARSGRGDPGLHDAPRHALRRDLLRARPRAPADPEARRGRRPARPRSWTT